MTLSITVKNTFLTFDTSASDRVPRSSSVPRTFKPCDYGDSLQSDDSTNASDKASDKCATENFQDSYSDSDNFQDIPDYRSEATEDFGEFIMPEWPAWQQAEFTEFTHSCVDATCCPEVPAADDPGMLWDDTSKVTLSLVDMVSTEAKARAKLRTQAQPFQSKMTPPTEVETLISNAAEVLMSGMDIINVQVTYGGMGGTTMIIGESASTDPDVQFTFSLVKETLLNVAEQSENTYVLGYGAQPFNNLDQLSFSANIGCVPAAHQDTACWDTYEKGYCPRCDKCRWDHPSKFDTMRIIVMIKKQTSSTWLD